MGRKQELRHRLEESGPGFEMGEQIRGRWGVKQKQGRNKLISRIDEPSDLFTIPLS